MSRRTGHRPDLLVTIDRLEPKGASGPALLRWNVDDPTPEPGVRAHSPSPSRCAGEPRTDALMGQGDATESLAFTAGSGGQLQLWDVASGRRLRTLTGAGGAMASAALDPGG